MLHYISPFTIPSLNTKKLTILFNLTALTYDSAYKPADFNNMAGLEK